MSDSKCRGCGEILRPSNHMVADGCPCNSRRGVNHGLVAPHTCTCVQCDPEQTGSSRATPSPPPKGGPLLEPCPFCGGSGVLDSMPVGDDAQVFVRCMSCAAEGPWGHSAGVAEGSWNRRSPSIEGAREEGRREGLREARDICLVMDMGNLRIRECVETINHALLEKP